MRAETIIGAAIISLATAHGDHSKTNGAPEVDENADWMTKHMAGRSSILVFDIWECPRLTSSA